MSGATQVNGASGSGKYIDGIDPDDPEYIKNLQRPAEVKEDIHQMENRSRVKVVLNSESFKEDLEQIVDEQMRNGPYPANLLALQQINELLMPGSKGGLSNLGRASTVIPVDDLRGSEHAGLSKGEKLLRCKLASLYRLVDICGWTHGIYNHISARVSADVEQFLINPFGMMYSEITASSLIKVDVNGDIVDPGTSHLSVNKAGFTLHSAIHQARPDIKCIVHLHTPAAVAVSVMKCGLLPLSQEAMICGNVSYHDYTGILINVEEKDKLARDLGVHNKIMLLRNHGIVACGETIEEAFHYTFNLMNACEAQIRAIPVGIDNLLLPSEEARQNAFKIASQGGGGVESSGKKWKTGELEFEALMRTLDNSGYRTGYMYRMPMIKQDKKDRSNSEVEIPPSSSSFTYVFDGDYENSKYVSPLKMAQDRQKKAFKAGWLTSPNAYKKTELEEIGTTTPKKITKWVPEADPQNKPGSVNMKVENPNQFAPLGQNPKEFKQKQKSIKKGYYEEKVDAGPQSKILEGMSWDEAQKAKDGQLSGAGDQVIVVGAASKGIIQRDHQHNAVVYRQYYAANPFENMSGTEIENYQDEVQKKEQFSEPEPAEPPPPEEEDSNKRQEAQDTEEANTRHSPHLVPRAPDNPTVLDSEGQDAVLARLAEKVVQTMMHEALAVVCQRGGKGQQILTGKSTSNAHQHTKPFQMGGQMDSNVGSNSQGDRSHKIINVDESSKGRDETELPFIQDSRNPSQRQSYQCGGRGDKENEIESLNKRLFHSAGNRDASYTSKIYIDEEASAKSEFVSLQINPIVVQHGGRADGMKIKFSIQSTVRRRISREIEQGSPIEEIFAAATQPTVHLIHSDQGTEVEREVNEPENIPLFISVKTTPKTNKTNSKEVNSVGPVTIEPHMTETRQIVHSERNHKAEEKKSGQEEKNIEQNGGIKWKMKVEDSESESESNEKELPFFDASEEMAENEMEEKSDVDSEHVQILSETCEKLLVSDDSPESNENEKSVESIKSQTRPSNLHRLYKPAKSSNRKKRAVQNTVVPLSPVREIAYEGTEVEMNEMEAILEALDDSFEQLLITAEDDLLLCDKGEGELDLNEFEGVAPLAEGEIKLKVKPNRITPTEGEKHRQPKPQTVADDFTHSPIMTSVAGNFDPEQVTNKSDNKMLMMPDCPSDLDSRSAHAEKANQLRDLDRNNSPGLQDIPFADDLIFRQESEPNLETITFSYENKIAQSVNQDNISRSQVVDGFPQRENKFKDDDTIPGTKTETIVDEIIPPRTTESSVDEIIPHRKTETNVDEIIPQRKTETNIDEIIPQRKTETSVDEIIPYRKTKTDVDEIIPYRNTETNVDEIILHRKTETNVDEIIPHRKTETNVDEIIPHRKTETNVDEIIPHRKTKTNVDEIIPHRKTETNVDIPQRTETNVDEIIPHRKTETNVDIPQRTETNVDEIIPHRKTETDVDEIIPYRNTETNVDEIIPHRKTETDVDEIILYRKTETNVDEIIPYRNTETNVDEIIPERKTETNVDEIIPHRKTETNVDEIIPHRNTETNVDETVSQWKSETNFDIIPQRTETNVDEIIPYRKTETNVDHINPYQNIGTDVDDITPNTKKEMDVSDVIPHRNTETIGDDFPIMKTESSFDEFLHHAIETDQDDSIQYMRTETDVDDVVPYETFEREINVPVQETEINVDDVSFKKIEVDVVPSIGSKNTRMMVDHSIPHERMKNTKKSRNYLFDSVSKEGPLQTSSPKLSRVKQSKGLYKDLCKSENTLLDSVSNERSPSKLDAKSQPALKEMADSPPSDDSFLFRSASYDPDHLQDLQGTNLLRNSRYEKSDDDGWKREQSPSFHSSRSVLDEYHLKKHNELMELSSAKSFLTSPNKPQFHEGSSDIMPPLPDTLDVPSISDIEDADLPIRVDNRSKRFRQSEKEMKMFTPVHKDIVPTGVSTMSSPPKTKWVPKSRRDKDCCVDRSFPDLSQSPYDNQNKINAANNPIDVTPEYKNEDKDIKQGLKGSGGGNFDKDKWKKKQSLMNMTKQTEPNSSKTSQDRKNDSNSDSESIKRKSRDNPRRNSDRDEERRSKERRKSHRSVDSSKDDSNEQMKEERRGSLDKRHGIKCEEDGKDKYDRRRNKSSEDSEDRRKRSEKQRDEEDERRHEKYSSKDRLSAERDRNRRYRSRDDISEKDNRDRDSRQRDGYDVKGSRAGEKEDRERGKDKERRWNDKGDRDDDRKRKQERSRRYSSDEDDDDDKYKGRSRRGRKERDDKRGDRYRDDDRNEQRDKKYKDSNVNESKRNDNAINKKSERKNSNLEYPNDKGKKEEDNDRPVDQWKKGDGRSRKIEGKDVSKDVRKPVEEKAVRVQASKFAGDGMNRAPNQLLNTPIESTDPGASPRLVRRRGGAIAPPDEAKWKKQNSPYKTKNKDYLSVPLTKRNHLHKSNSSVHKSSASIASSTLSRRSKSSSRTFENCPEFVPPKLQLNPLTGEPYNFSHPLMSKSMESLLSRSSSRQLYHSLEGDITNNNRLEDSIEEMAKPPISSEVERKDEINFDGELKERVGKEKPTPEKNNAEPEEVRLRATETPIEEKMEKKSVDPVEGTAVLLSQLQSDSETEEKSVESPPKKGLFTRLSCVGGRSAVVGKKKTDGKNKEPLEKRATVDDSGNQKEYYAAEKKRIKRLVKSKETEQMGGVYFQKEDDESDTEKIKDTHKSTMRDERRSKKAEYEVSRSFSTFATHKKTTEGYGDYFEEEDIRKSFHEKKLKSPPRRTIDGRNSKIDKSGLTVEEVGKDEQNQNLSDKKWQPRALRDKESTLRPRPSKSPENPYPPMIRQDSRDKKMDHIESVHADTFNSTPESILGILSSSAPAHFSLEHSHSPHNQTDPSMSFDSTELSHYRKHVRRESCDGDISFPLSSSSPYRHPDSPVRRRISQVSLGFESGSNRPRSSSTTTNPLTYQPWRSKSKQRGRSMSISEMVYAAGVPRPTRSHSVGEITYNNSLLGNVGRRRSRTNSIGDIAITSRMYHRRRSRSHSRASLGDTSFGSVAPGLQRRQSGSWSSHPAELDVVPPAPVKRSESAREPSKNAELIEELSRKNVERPKSERQPQIKEELGEDKPVSPSKSDTMKSTDSASGGETLEERSSKEGSPTKEHPTAKDGKKGKKKKFRIPSFSKKNKKEAKESKESAI